MKFCTISLAQTNIHQFTYLLQYSSVNVENMNCIHIVGSINGFSNFSEGNVGLQCSYEIQTTATLTSKEAEIKVVEEDNHSLPSSLWILQNGQPNGTTQLHDSPIDKARGVWNHPIDVQFATTGIRGWPKIRFQIFSQNAWGRRSFVGFGCYSPFPSGGQNDKKEADVVIWRPCDGFLEKIRCFFMMGRHLRNSQERISSFGEVESVGVVHLSISVLVSKF